MRNRLIVPLVCVAVEHTASAQPKDGCVQGRQRACRAAANGGKVRLEEQFFDVPSSGRARGVARRNGNSRSVARANARAQVENRLPRIEPEQSNIRLFLKLSFL